MSQRNNNQRNLYYYNGNTVRKLKPQQQRRPQQQIKRVPQTRSQKRARTSMSKGFLVLFAAAAVACVMICVYYLQLQAKVTAKNAEIKSLRTQVSELKTQNDSIDYELNSQIDVNAICKKAVKKLGMVPVSKHQVAHYNKTENEYVKQVENIPEK